MVSWYTWYMAWLLKGIFLNIHLHYVHFYVNFVKQLFYIIDYRAMYKTVGL